MNIRKFIAITGALIMLSNCAAGDIDFYRDTEPRADIKEYSGPSAPGEWCRTGEVA